MTANTIKLCPFTGSDLDAVIALDKVNSGDSRRGFFEKRNQAIQREPDGFIGLVAYDGDELVGFALASVLDGEFGSERTVAVLDSLGVSPGRRGKGIGKMLLQSMIDAVRDRGGCELQTQAEWTQPGLMDFFSSAGFRLAPRLVLERSTDEIAF